MIENMHESPSALGDNDGRFEILPLGKGEEEAAQLPEPVRLTVTCSPKLGPDRSVEVAGRLHDLGHAVTVHVAARMVRDRAHLDELMSGMAAAGVDDVFLIGGDAAPVGAYESAVDLLPVIADHPQRPPTIGIAGYPEGHPLIAPETLASALAEKSRLASYVTTQLCFDPDALLSWIAGWRGRGMTLPVLIGIPGKVTAARLLEMSMRVGVGPSMAFVRKQRGMRTLFGLFRRSASDRLYSSLAPSIGDPELNIAGFHYYTFNQLIDTWQWQHEKPGRGSVRRPSGAFSSRGHAYPEESKT
jgi:methylenetetrahydrofolate reductase (NADPH)